MGSIWPSKQILDSKVTWQTYCKALQKKLIKKNLTWDPHL